MALATHSTSRGAQLAGIRYLSVVLAGVPGAAASASLLVTDALLAVAFAGGLAGALSAIASGASVHVLPWLALTVAAALARGLGSAICARLGAGAASAAKLRVRRRIVSAALDAPTAVLPGRDTSGALLSLAVDEIEALDSYVARFLPVRRAAVAGPLVVLGAVAWASPVSAALLALTLVPFVLLMALAGMASAAESHRQFAALARLSGLFVDRLRALPVVLAFGAQRRETQRLAEASLDVARRTARVLRVAFLSSAVLEFFSALCVALVAVYAGFNLLGLLPMHVPEKLDLEHAFFVLALAPEFYLPMRRLAAAYHDRSAAMAAAERLEAFEGARRTSSETPAVVRAHAQAPAVRFNDVSIRYQDEGRPAVSHVSFDLRPGQTLAIVGPSGSGKTSLLRLLVGMAPRCTGEVWIDGAPIDAQRGVASEAAWVGQSPLIVRGTLLSNLLLAAPDASPDALMEAIRKAGLGPTIARRLGGLDAPLDERGSCLSGGERRRIALARALLKPSSIWLLDEPTAHLDDASEIALVATIAHARAGRTTLIATHSERLAALANVVIRLEPQ